MCKYILYVLGDLLIQTFILFYEDYINIQYINILKYIANTEVLLTQTFILFEDALIIQTFI